MSQNKELDPEVSVVSVKETVEEACALAKRMHSLATELLTNVTSFPAMLGILLKRPVEEGKQVESLQSSTHGLVYAVHCLEEASVKVGDSLDVLQKTCCIGKSNVKPSPEEHDSVIPGECTGDLVGILGAFESLIALLEAQFVALSDQGAHLVSLWFGQGSDVMPGYCRNEEQKGDNEFITVSICCQRLERVVNDYCVWKERLVDFLGDAN